MPGRGGGQTAKLEAGIAQGEKEVANWKAAARALEGKLATSAMALENEQSSTSMLQAEREGLLAAKKKVTVPTLSPRP